MRARKDAMASVTKELGWTGTLPANCDTWTILSDADITDACVLPGTDYHVSIKAGSASIACESCDPLRSVQVGIRNARYKLAFAGFLGQVDKDPASPYYGQSYYNVGVTSVAGLAWSKSYAVVTLRPRAATGSTYDVRDIRIEGGSHVTVSTGDVATNSNMEYSGTEFLVTR